MGERKSEKEALVHPSMHVHSHQTVAKSCAARTVGRTVCNRQSNLPTHSDTPLAIW